MEDIGYSLLVMLIATTILYIIALIKTFQSWNKYRYSFLWVLLAIILYPGPFYIFIIYPYCEKRVVSNNPVKKEKAKIKVRQAWFFVISYMVYFILLCLFFKYGMDTNLYKEITIVCASTAAALYQFATFFFKDKNK